MMDSPTSLPPSPSERGPDVVIAQVEELYAEEQMPQGRIPMLLDGLRQVADVARRAIDATRRRQHDAEVALLRESSAESSDHHSMIPGFSVDSRLNARFLTEEGSVPSGALRTTQMLLSSVETQQMTLHDDLTESARGEMHMEQAPARAVVASAIVLNMIVLCIETDHPEWSGWIFLKALFLAFYIVEFAMRVYDFGFWGLLRTSPNWAWSLYDFVVIVVGVVDFVVCLSFERRSSLTTRSASAAGYDSVHDEPALVQILQTTTILRMYRLVRLHPKLYAFAGLLRRMVNTFVWILSLVFVLCFVLSIIMTQLVGHGLVFGGDQSHMEQEAQSLFSTVPTTLFTLFQLTTMDNWASIAGPMIQLSVFWRFFFVAFIMCVSWTLLSLLTAVASEIMMEGQAEAATEEVVLQEVRRQRFVAFLCSEFLKVDTDRNGQLNRDEFMHLMTQPSMLSALAAHGVDLKRRDLQTTWDAFDLDDSGELTIDELVDGFSFLMQNLATKQVASVGHTLKRFTRRIEVVSQAVEQHLERVAKKQEEIVSWFPGVQASDQAQDLALSEDESSAVAIFPPEGVINRGV
mmetsp:Transcript_127777/g.367831  ORF Transcript_127777/g.367831 Transcript_127777/m.367831 type:complete len:576 (-) Transcript_127777:52-1779(-)